MVGIRPASMKKERKTVVGKTRVVALIPARQGVAGQFDGGRMMAGPQLNSYDYNDNSSFFLMA